MAHQHDFRNHHTRRPWRDYARRVVLGSPRLGFVDASAADLAAAIAARLGPSDAVADVVLLRLQTLDVALSLGSPVLLTDQRAWESHRLPATHGGLTPVDLDRAVIDELALHLHGDRITEIQDLHDRASAKTPEPMQTASPADLPSGARAYLEYALAGRRDECMDVVREALRSGVEPAEVMSSILQPAQLELGRLWASDRISVADEHFVTGLTQQCMALLYPVVPLQRSADAPRIVSLTVGSEAHELGIRMVSEVMAHAGWHTAYLGADVPHRDVVTFVAATRPHVVAVSATMTGHMLAVRDLVAALRADRRCAGVSILVGGRPFALNPELASLVDADGWAPGPREALQLCRTWVAS